MSTKFWATIALALLAFLSNAGNNDMDTSKLYTELKDHIEFLASDSLEGRLTGSRGEQLAFEYIIAEFKKTGIEPGLDESYIQSFDFTAGKILKGENSLRLAGKLLNLHSDFFPMSLSGNGKLTGDLVHVNYGIEDSSLNYSDYDLTADQYEGKIMLINVSLPDGYHPHSKYIAWDDFRKKIKLAKEKGASAVIFYNIDSSYSAPEANYRGNTQPESIPVIYCNDCHQFKSPQNAKATTVELATNLENVKKTGNNVVGYIDNGSEFDIVIGAHYDHLGYGEYGSLHAGEPMIHNGADDNASGVAAMIELAELLKESAYNGNNYMFVAFSGEELGLYGSKSLVSAEAFKSDRVNYMINMDMVGRLEEKLAVNGVGTSPAWSLISDLSTAGYSIKTSESGIGPSDHTSFYLKDIPVIHFFTGTHEDYHKPGDDAHKINYEGIIEVMDVISTIVAELDDDGKIAFTKTKDQDQGSVPRFTVTLGVIPDYMFEGRGMRIDGVREGKPAESAGIQVGDIVTLLGEYEVVDMMSYMKALSQFKKGDKTTVRVKREEDELEMEIQF